MRINNIKRIKDFITNPQIRFSYMTILGVYNKLSDEEFLKKKYKVVMGKDLDLDNPKGFNEKLQWLKIHNRKPEYTIMVDKHLAKTYVAEKIGEKYIIPTIGVWDKFEDIDFEKLPNNFVLKCTHDSGGLVICRDKSKLDLKKTRKKINKCLKRDYYMMAREWAYKDVPRKIICEKYMQDKDKKILPVYKVFCFNGEAKIIQFIQNDKSPMETVDYYDTNWNLLDLKQNFPNSKNPNEKPECLEEIIECAEKLTQNVPFLRGDFYEINGKVYFSELTFYSDGGMASFRPEDWNIKLGEYIKLK